MNAKEDTCNPPLTGQSGWFDREVGWLRANSRAIALAGIIALFIDLLVIAFLSTGPLNVFHNDAFLLLDDGWRVLNGQAPHRDFNSPLGPLEFCIVGVGMMLARASAHGIAFGIAIFGFALGTWTWFLCRARMPSVFAILVTAWVVLTATCPTPPGFDPRFLSCAMIYNRQGYALLGIILIECGFASERNRFSGGLSSGISLVLLVFLKANFSVIALLLLLATVPLARIDRARLMGILTGAGGAFVAFLLYLRFSLAAFLADMSFVAHARGPSLSFSGLIHSAGTCAKSGNAWLVVGTTVALLLLLKRQELRRRQTVTLVILSIVVLASGPFFVLTNSLENRAELASLWIIILLDRISEIHLRPHGNKMATLILTAGSLGAVLGALAPDVASTLNLITYQSSARENAGIHIAAPGMGNMAFYDSTTFYDNVKAGDGDGTYYVDCLDDGMTLLSANSNSDETILALGFHNPFSYLLRRRPAQGGSSYLFMGNSMSETSMPPADWVFGNADLMVLPENEGTHRDSDLFIQNYYRAYLTQNFRFVAKSRYWSLYRRNRSDL
jgi:hypothetical protein